jgi:hypothetical protein
MMGRGLDITQPSTGHFRIVVKFKGDQYLITISAMSRTRKPASCILEWKTAGQIEATIPRWIKLYNGFIAAASAGNQGALAPDR